MARVDELAGWPQLQAVVDPVKICHCKSEAYDVCSGRMFLSWRIYVALVTLSEITLGNVNDGFRRQNGFEPTVVAVHAEETVQAHVDDPGAIEGIGIDALERSGFKKELLRGNGRSHAAG